MKNNFYAYNWYSLINLGNEAVYLSVFRNSDAFVKRLRPMAGMLKYYFIIFKKRLKGKKILVSSFQSYHFHIAIAMTS